MKARKCYSRLAMCLGPDVDLCEPPVTRGRCSSCYRIRVTPGWTYAKEREFHRRLMKTTKEISR